ITEGHHRVLDAWMNGAFPSRHSATDVDLTRGFVVEGSRGLGLYKTMMLATLLATMTDASRHVRAAVEPTFHHLAFLIQLGFEVVAPPMTFYDQPRTTVAVRLVCALAKRHREWTSQLAALRGQLFDRGVAYELPPSLSRWLSGPANV